jgi:dolichol-phosphate mannosyltransferase
MNTRPLLSIVSPCYNEEDNIEELYNRIKAVTITLSDYDFELIFIDNKSTDNTVKILKELASTDASVKIIINVRNFGHIRSPYYGMLQSNGLATILMASDLQDPPEVIPEFIHHWEQGYKLVMATKPKSKGSFLMHSLRKMYYRFLDKISEITIVKDSTGFGLYDKVVLDQLRKIDDPYPFLRGLICELGYDIKTVTFEQSRRLRGISKNNFYTLYDIAMLGIVSHTKVPIRIMAFMGFIMGFFSFIAAFVFLVLKLLYWDAYPMGMAPILIGLFFIFGMLSMFLGIIGEYIGVIHTYVQKRPIVVEKERIGFDDIKKP